MRIVIGAVSLLLLMGGFGISQEKRQPDTATCGFAVQGELTRATVVGPDDLVPLVYVVEQPDSPIEIASVDLTGMWLSVANEKKTWHDCAQYKVHNRSDRVIQRFGIELL